MCRELVSSHLLLRTDDDARGGHARQRRRLHRRGRSQGHADLPARPPDERGSAVAEMARELAWPIVRGLHELRQPIVASVRGHVIGVGVQLVLSADLTIASETARLLLPMARLGHSVDHGESYYLPRRVAPHRAMQMLMLIEPGAGDAEDMASSAWVVPDVRLERRQTT
jgi:2-(1,2-epoxy-1,2-dihydrophenyl)acetyl-CoA isomerase